MISADQLVLHGVGDYILQSDWMAQTKTKKSVAALAHVITYSLPFLLLTQSWKALLVIAGSHFIIDRWRLARYVVWAKNYLSPRWKPPVVGKSIPIKEGEIAQAVIAKSLWNPGWADVKDSFGYPAATPPWLAMWLMIIADNLMHVIINGLAIQYLK